MQTSKQALSLVLPIGYAAYPGALVSDPSYKRDGLVASAGLNHRHTLGQFSLSEGFTYSRQAAQGGNFRSNAFSFFVGGLTQLPHQIFAVGSLSYTYSAYPDSDLGRNDSKFGLNLEANKKVTLFIPVMASLDFGWERNSSTVSAAAYSKQTISLKLTYAIK